MQEKITFDMDIWLSVLELSMMYIEDDGCNTRKKLFNKLHDDFGDDILPWLSAIMKTVYSWPSNIQLNQRQVKVLSKYIVNFYYKGITSYPNIENLIKNKFGTRYKIVAPTIIPILKALYKGIAEFFGISSNEINVPIGADTDTVENSSINLDFEDYAKALLLTERYYKKGIRSPKKITKKLQARMGNDIVPWIPSIIATMDTWPQNMAVDGQKIAEIYKTVAILYEHKSTDYLTICDYITNNLLDENKAYFIPIIQVAYNTIKQYFDNNIQSTTQADVDNKNDDENIYLAAEGTSSQKFDDEIWQLGFRVGSSYIHLGLIHYKDWSKEMIKVLEEKIRPYLISIWRAILSMPIKNELNIGRLVTCMRYVHIQYEEEKHTLEEIENGLNTEFGESFYHTYCDYIDIAFEVIDNYYHPYDIIIREPRTVSEFNKTTTIIAKLGRLYIRCGYNTFQTWKEVMVTEIGDTMASWLKPIWNGLIALFQTNKEFRVSMYILSVRIYIADYKLHHWETFEDSIEDFREHFDKDVIYKVKNYLYAAFVTVKTMLYPSENALTYDIDK